VRVGAGTTSGNLAAFERLLLYRKSTMTKLYLSNATKQRLKFSYRLPEANRIFEQEIHSGRQVVIGEDWSDTQIDFVVKQLDRAGFKRAHETNGKLENFSGWLYSVDKTTTENQIRSGHEARVEAQETISVVEAQRGALAMDQSNRAPKDRRKRLAKVTQVEVQEEIGPRNSPTGNEVHMSVSVDAAAPEGAALSI
jgi:hypothetical protein